MRTLLVVSWTLLLALGLTGSVTAQVIKQIELPAQELYQYESKPAGEEFAVFNPAKAPPSGPLLLKEGDRLAIIGDSITEQKMYSRIIENYLTACTPQLNVTVRQYGWSGEKTAGFLQRMDRDCLTFEPTIATLCYGMNDSRYRPFDVTNGRWYRDHYTAIVRKFKAADVRVVVGSPGCAGKLASWVENRAGDLDDHNLNLCAFRDIAMQVAVEEQVSFADIFWPMYQQQVLAPRRFNKTPEQYAVAGKDGIHPGWAGQTIMAYAFLTALGFDGDLGSIQVDWKTAKATTTGLHEVVAVKDGGVRLISRQYPYCGSGQIDDDNSLRSGMSLVPFADRLNRLILKVQHAPARARISWGTQSKQFSAQQLAEGINLAAEFETTPFAEAFARVDEAVLAKQSFETHQVKTVFHGEPGRTDFEKAVRETEAKRRPLVLAVAQSVIPIEHEIKIDEIDQ